MAILRALMEGEKSVGLVVEETRGQANVLKHLKLLFEAGLVARRKEGLQVFYRVGDPVVEKLCRSFARRSSPTSGEVEHKGKLLNRTRERGRLGDDGSWIDGSPARSGSFTIG